MQKLMAKKRTDKEPGGESSKRYPSRENTRYAGIPLAVFQQLEQIGEPIERSVSYLARKAINLWLKLRPLEQLLDKVEAEDLPQLQKCLEEIAKKKK